MMTVRIIISKEIPSDVRAMIRDNDMSFFPGGEGIVVEVDMGRKALSVSDDEPVVAGMVSFELTGKTGSTGVVTKSLVETGALGAIEATLAGVVNTLVKVDVLLRDVSAVMLVGAEGREVAATVEVVEEE